MAGDTAGTMVVRAIGPGLTSFGLTGLCSIPC